MPTQLTQAPAPGARVLIRDEEWLVQRADASEHGGWQLAWVYPKLYATARRCF